MDAVEIMRFFGNMVVFCLGILVGMAVTILLLKGIGGNDNS